MYEDFVNTFDEGRCAYCLSYSPYENLPLGYHGDMLRNILNVSSLVFVKQIFVILNAISIYKVILLK